MTNKNMKEVSIEHQYFNEPADWQKSNLNKILEKERGTANVAEKDGTGSITTTTTESQTTTTETEPTANPTEEDKSDNKEWENEWKSRGVSEQFQNIGVPLEDQYDKKTRKDYFGNDAAYAASSLKGEKPIMKTEYTKAIANNEKYKSEWDKVQTARKEKAPIRNWFDNTKRAIENKKQDINKKVAAATDTAKQQNLANINLGNKPTESKPVTDINQIKPVQPAKNKDLENEINQANQEIEDLKAAEKKTQQKLANASGDESLSTPPKQVYDESNKNTNELIDQEMEYFGIETEVSGATPLERAMKLRDVVSTGSNPDIAKAVDRLVETAIQVEETNKRYEQAYNRNEAYKAKLAKSLEETAKALEEKTAARDELQAKYDANKATESEKYAAQLSDEVIKNAPDEESKKFYDNFKSQLATAGTPEECADILTNAKKDLSKFTGEQYNNFKKAVITDIGFIAGDYFIQTQTTNEGAAAVEKSFVKRAIDAYNTNSLNFGEKLLYTFGFGDDTENTKGVQQLRDIATEALERGNLPDEFKGKVMASVIAQTGKTVEIRTLGNLLSKALIGGAVAATAANPLITAAGIIYATASSAINIKKLQDIANRKEDNEAVLETGKPTENYYEDIYNKLYKSNITDYTNLALGIAATAVGTMTANPVLIATGAKYISEVDTLSQQVRDFVGDYAFDTTLDLASKEVIGGSSGSSETNDNKKKYEIDELEEVSATSENSETAEGLNMPAISNDDLAWIVRRPELRNLSI